VTRIRLSPQRTTPAFGYRRIVAGVGLLGVAAVLGIGGPAPRALAQQPALTEGGLEVVQIRPDFYMIVGAGGNVAVQIGPIGVVLVDAGSAVAADTLLATIKTLTDRPIRYIISTSAEPDHVGGNEKLSKAGVTILGGARGNASFTEDVTRAIDLNGGLASVLAHEEVLARMSRPPGQPSALWPSKVYSGRHYSMALNGDGIQVFHQPAAHSDGDSVVLFRRADVVVAGDIVDINRFPVIDVEAGGSIQGEIDALNHLLELVIPPFPLTWQAAGSFVIPGHGRPLDYSDVEEYRDMVVILRDVIDDMVGRGLTLAQVKAADPTKAYRGRYGADAGPWTTDMFVEAVFKGLTSQTSDRLLPKSN
jgi:cyclase